VDGNGLPVRLGLTGGQAHDNRLCSVLLRHLPRRARLLADRGYDADWIRAFVAERGAWANIPPKRNRKDPICFSPYLYRDRNLVERFFNKIRQCPDTTSSPPTTSLSSSSPASAYGCAFMSARPSHLYS
jgi:transposase